MGRKKERTDEELLGIAYKVFLAEGPGVATSTIAKAAEVSQATLFKRFQTKRKLMILALAPASQSNPVIELLEELPDERPIPLQMVDIATTLYELMKEREPAIAVLKAAGITMQECYEADEESPMIRGPQMMLKWVEEARSKGLVCNNIAPMTFVMAFAGSVRNLAMGNIFVGEHTSEEFVAQQITQLVDLLWMGMSPSAN